MTRYSSYILLTLIVLASFGLRFWWSRTQTPVISIEGAEYVRMAQNLRAGNGLKGNFDGPETMYTPLYPVVIAGVLFLTKNAELAGHFVAAAVGAALVLPVFFLALYLYGRRIAYIAAALAAVHPYLVARAGSIYTEPVYQTLLLAAVYWGLRAMEIRRMRYALLCGVGFGLAYLTRPEAFAYPVFFALAICTVAVIEKKPLTLAASAAVLVLLSFALVASPYVAFLHAHTGQIRLEGKWNINYTMGKRIQSGMDILQAAYGIDENGREQGSLLDPVRFASYTPFPHSLKDKLQYMLASARRNRNDTYTDLFDTAFGEPILFTMVIVALFRGPWDRERMIRESVLLVMTLSILILMLTAHYVQFRYADPLLALWMPWVAKGLDELRDWGSKTAQRFSPSVALQEGCGICFSAALCCLMLVISFADTRSVPDFMIEQRGYLGVRNAGLWLDAQPGPKRIAAVVSVIPYYSEGTFVQFPYASQPQTLRYFDSRGANFIVLEGHFAKGIPTMEAWMTSGFQNSRAELVYDSGGPLKDRVEIYYWSSQITSPSVNSRAAVHG